MTAIVMSATPTAFHREPYEWVWSRRLFDVLIVCVALFIPTTGFSQIARSWNTTSGDWSIPINWLPNGVPAADDGAFIGNSAVAENAFMTLDIDDTVAGVQVTDGMTLQTNGNTLTVLGDTLLSGSNTEPLMGGGSIIYASGIVVDRGVGSDDYDTDNLTVTDGARVRLDDGGILEVDGTLTVDAESAVRGDGVIRLINSGTVYVNDGILDPGVGGMIINVTGGGAIDLDGTAGNGRVFLSGALIDGTNFDDVTINGGTLTDTFNGDIDIGANGLLTMNLAAPWATGPGSEITLFGSSLNPGPTRIDGVDLTIGGDVRITGGNAHGVITSDTTFTSTAQVTLGVGDRFELDGEADVDGGMFTIGEDGVVQFDGPTTFRGGTFDAEVTDAFAPSVVLNGATIYRDDVTFAGHARQVGDASIAENTVIDAEILDMDGTGSTVWDVNATATINTDRIEVGTAPNASFEGTIDVAGPLTARLTVNLSDPNESWSITGALNLSGNAVFNSTKLAGSPIRVTGDANISGLVGVTADAHFAGAGAIDFASAATTLQMSGDTAVDASVTFTGNGELANSTQGVMSLAAGLSTGQVGVANSGRLELGATVGVVSVDRFDNLDGATLVADVGRNSIGTDSDVLTTSSGAANLAGFLQPNIVNIGGMFEPPEIGDSFTVLTAVGGVNGTFADVLDSLLGGQVYEWNAIYNPANVVIEVAAIGGLLGDYNANGVVDAADYSVWLDTLNSMTDLRADGNLNGVIDQADYDFWQANFGDTLGSGARTAVPEPASQIVLLLAVLAFVQLWLKADG